MDFLASLQSLDHNKASMSFEVKDIESNTNRSNMCCLLK